MHKVKSKGITKKAVRYIAGFTLVEMIIALAIGAGISVMSYRALEGMIRSDERVSLAVKQVDSLDRVWQYFSSDLMHAVDRRSNISNLPAMEGVFGDRLAQSDATSLNEDDYLLRFVRGDRDNLLNLVRSSLYEVAYSLSQEEDIEGQTLWRDRRPIDVDGASTEIPRKKRRLLDGVKSLKFEYLPQTFTRLESSAWETGWPPQNVNLGNDGEEGQGLPAAVRITIDTVTLGEVVRTFSLTVAEDGGQ